MIYMDTIIISQLKKFTAFAAVVLVAVMYSSCTDLDETPYTFIDPDSYYKTTDDLDAALNNAYRDFRDMAGSRRNYVAKLEVTTDQGEPNYRKEQPLLDYSNAWVESNNVTYTFSDLWANAYVVINDANIILGRMGNIEMTDTEANNFKGQALFLRAYALYHLVRIYGGCPIPLTYTSSVSGLEMERSSIEEVYEQITEELEFGATYLPKKGDSNYDEWRATSGSCYALLGEVYLYKATISNEDNFSADESDLKKSMEYSYEVISSGKYQLMSDFTQLWYWFNADAKNNVESIFELQYSNTEGNANNMAVDFGIGNSSGIKNVAGTYYCRYGPSVELYNSYDDNDTRKKIFLTEFTERGTDITYTYDADEQTWFAEDGSAYTPENYAYHTLLNAKYFDPWADPETDRSRPGTNFPMLRYSEVLLNYAEAANLLNAGDGLEQLNLVHTRAGLPAYSSMSQEEMDEAIIQERMWEFPGECKAYYDQLRKGVLGDRAEEYIHTNHQLYLEEKYVSSASNSRVKLRFSYAMQFKPKKSFLWKIPTTDLNSNSMLEQNPDNVSQTLKYND